MNNIAIYAGTFDPITFGHIDLVQRALSVVDKIIIAVAISTKKKPLFTLSERVALVQEVLKNKPGVTVQGFDGLLLDFARAHQATIILRGLRTVTDFDYEFQLAAMNRRMDPSVETVFLLPDEKYMSVSSTLVREIAHFGGDVGKFVPPEVVAAFKKKFNAG